MLRFFFASFNVRIKSAGLEPGFRVTIDTKHGRRH